MSVDTLEQLGATFVARFDKAIVADKPTQLQFERHGGRIIADGVSGGALQLRKGEYLAFDARSVIRSDEGTVAFWVRPHWGFYDKKNALTSHTFASLTWSDGRNGYFVISDGWWEPDGAFNTYFIKNNQEYAHTARRITYKKDEWMHLACSWSSVGAGSVRLYANGTLIAEKKVSAKYPAGPLTFHIGSDKGTPVSKPRWADSDIDEVVFFGRALDDKGIQDMIRLQNPGFLLKKGVAPEKVSSIRYPAARDRDGRVLEARVIFDEGTGWMSRQGADRIIRDIKKAGFNVYVPCVWHGAGTRYPSKVALPETGRDFKHFDPLEYLIKNAHANGIQVHPWFTVSLRHRAFLGDYYGPGSPSQAFDVHRPGFRQFIIDLVVDVIRRYRVDGINLDYVRAMGICKCSYCVSEYQKKYKASLLDDVNRKGHKGGLVSSLQEWQDQAVEAIIRGISEKARSLKNNIVVSVNGHPIPSFLPANAEGRQEVKWANADLIDVIFDMDYTQQPDFEKHELIRKEVRNPGKVIMLLGNYDRDQAGRVIPRDAKMLMGLTSYVQENWPGGVGIYLYSQLSAGQIGALAAGPFKHKAKAAWLPR